MKNKTISILVSLIILVMAFCVFFTDDTNAAGGVIQFSNYVTPEQYGAKGDGVTDDATAIQNAVNSGKNILFDSTKTYFIGANKTINVSNKNDFHVYGGNIHKAATTNASYYGVFNLQNCTNCSFEEMYIYSEFTVADQLVPSGHTRPDTAHASNVIAYWGNGNNGLQFINNRFAYLHADFWFNTSEAAFNRNITIDGWTSSTTMMPFFARCLENLTVKNAKVDLNPQSSGNGDHCMYIEAMCWNFYVSDSTFRWTGSNDMLAVITCHLIGQPPELQPKNINFDNVEIDAGNGRAMFIYKGATVTIRNSKISNNGSVAGGVLFASNGDGGAVNIYDSELISGGQTNVFNTFSYVGVYGCTITTSTSAFVSEVVSVVEMEDTKINIDKGGLYYTNSSKDVNHHYVNCTINKSGTTGGKTYFLSKRQPGGMISFVNCDISCGNGAFVYNGGSATMNGINFINTRITKASQLAQVSEKKDYTAINSTFNGGAM